MIPYGFKERQSEHHLLLACTAVLLSVVFHVIMMLFFADWSLGAMSRLQEKRHEWLAGDRVPPMRVQTLAADPLRGAGKVIGERDEPSRGPMTVEERVDTLSEAAKLTMNVPLAREAMAHTLPAVKELDLAPMQPAPWLPRQEIVQIFDKSVQDAVATLPRREIPKIERVTKALDIVPSVDLADRRLNREPEAPKPIATPDILDAEFSRGSVSVLELDAPGSPSQLSTEATEALFALRTGAKSGVGLAALRKMPEQALPPPMQETNQPLPQAALAVVEQQAREAQAQISALQAQVDYTAIDDLLSVILETYRDPAEPGRVYYRIALQPHRDKKLATLAKDLIFIQDVSASITEERLTYCRRALVSALATLNPGDRFNVMAFRDNLENCFQGWAPVNEENLKKAADFVGRLRSYGQTDVFGSLRALLTLPRDPRRPMLGLLVTDGKPTFGVTKSAPIITEFTKLNQGMVSVYMFGTQRQANRYLLDMLTYCNRGNATVLNGNRWDIPASMAKVYQGFREPVLSDITVVFDSASHSEVYPKRTLNLYREQPMILNGVCAEQTEELIFQVRGLAADRGFDAIVRLKLRESAQPGGAELKTQWAHQKMYYLVGDYTRASHQKVLSEMLQVHKAYGVAIPYETELR